jgi:hypothetical protein
MFLCPRRQADAAGIHPGEVRCANQRDRQACQALVARQQRWRDSRQRLTPPGRNPVLLLADLQATADLRYH